LGIEPTASTADVSEKMGIPVLRDFFGQELARKISQADLIIGNNVYAHVPDINDFTKGLKYLLKVGGTMTLEFPHLMHLIKERQFDTVYHEHYSYLSLHTVCKIFKSAGLRIYDVDELPTHGGSLRVYGCHLDDPRPGSFNVEDLLGKEKSFGICTLDTFIGFQEKSDKIKNDLLEFLIYQKHLGKKVSAYGAAAKGNTLLNYAGIKKDLLPFVCDSALSKQGKFLPGSHIPVFSPSILKEEKPDSIIILPWNIKEEVLEKYNFIREWNGEFVTIIPSFQRL
jgi:hypothetical protein